MRARRPLAALRGRALPAASPRRLSPPLPFSPSPPAPAEAGTHRGMEGGRSRPPPRCPPGVEERPYRSASGAPLALRRRQHSASCRELALRRPRLQLRSLSAVTSAVWLAAYGIFVLSEVRGRPHPSPRGGPRRPARPAGGCSLGRGGQVLGEASAGWTAWGCGEGAKGRCAPASRCYRSDRGSTGCISSRETLQCWLRYLTFDPY